MPVEGVPELYPPPPGIPVSVEAYLSGDLGGDSSHESRDDPEAASRTDASYRASLVDRQLRSIADQFSERRRLLVDGGGTASEISQCERRLLASSNAAVVGGALGVERAIRAALSEDSSLAFAGAFVLGLFEGPRIAELLRELWERRGTELCFTSLLEAAQLSPNRELPAAIRPLSSSPLPAVREGVVRCLGARGDVTSDDLEAALADDDALVRRAAMEFSRSGGESLVPILARDLHQPSGLVQSAAAVALLLIGKQEGLEYCRWKLQHAVSDLACYPLATVIGVAGCGADFPEIEAAWSRSGGAKYLAEGLGWLGDLRGVPLVMKGLMHADVAVREASLTALERLGGTSFGKLARHGSERGTDASELYRSWYDHWRGRLTHLDLSKRFRAGKLFTPRALLGEIFDVSIPLAERVRAQTEWLVRMGYGERLHLGGFQATWRPQHDVLGD
ncbi:MAG: hypothetical protein AAF488_08035, partial [Planctomycetota bacterium]